MFHTDDTICAISSAAGGAARGMVRISGRDAIGIVAGLFEATDGRSLAAVQFATALPGRVCVGLDSSPRWIPCDLFLWPTSRSYTREPVAELHTIGSRPVLESLQAAVCGAGARLAEPGEFTLRAFLAGRLDLTQAEAVLGVIDAHGSEDLDAALAQLAGGLARPLHLLRDDLLQLLAELEAGLDFVEEDIEFVSFGELVERLESAGRLLDDVSQQMASRHVANETQQIALVGAPNVGKSSLFNALVQRHGVLPGNGSKQATPALVSPQRGTTRDYLNATIEIDGVRCELVDTAGVDTELLKTSTADIDSRAQAIATQRRKHAAIRAFCIEASATMVVEESDCDLIVLTKSDLVSNSLYQTAVQRNVPIVCTSSRTGEGLDTLCDVIREWFTRDGASHGGQVIAITAERCRESIRLAANALNAAVVTVQNNEGNELVAVELRAALCELGKVVGAVYTDDLLDRIFSTFCIGK